VPALRDGLSVCRMDDLKRLSSSVFNVTVMELAAIIKPANSGLMITWVNG
jgi:hypothetical protein